MAWTFNPFSAKLDYYKTSGGGGASPLTTKGDLYGFSAADERIPIGTEGQQLVVTLAEALGVKWVSSVQAFDGGAFSDTYVDTVDFDAGSFI